MEEEKIRLIKRTLFDLAGTKNSSWTDRICFWQNMKIFAEIEFRQKRIIPFRRLRESWPFRHIEKKGDLFRLIFG
jgi:hypothetical protein